MTRPPAPSRLLLIVLVTLAGALAAAAPALARSRTTVILRDGFWGGVTAAGGGVELASFDVRRRAISHLRFQITMRCTQRDDPAAGPRAVAFSAGRGFPGATVPGPGHLRTAWTETGDGGFVGQVIANFYFDARHPNVDLIVRVVGDATHPQDCEGASDIRLHRGPLHSHPAVPTG